MATKGGFLRLVMIFTYCIAFICAVVITGSFAWFTATQFSTRNVVTLALGVVTMLYTLICVITTCCTAGVSFFALASIVLDFVFAAVMIAVAVLNRSGRYGCDGGGRWPRIVYGGSSLSGCRLFVASFAVAIVVVFCFLITIVTQFLIRRRSRRDNTHVSKA